MMIHSYRSTNNFCSYLVQLVVWTYIAQGKLLKNNSRQENYHMHFLIIVAHGTSCEVYPSGYAYLPHSVHSHERASVNCTNYPAGLQASIYTEQYAYCNGTQLRLSDSDYCCFSMASRILVSF